MNKIIPSLLLCTAASTGALAQIATYSFTGTPTGDNQFNQVTAQPAGATFSPFTRVNLIFDPGANIFDSRGWSTGFVPDLTQYAQFTITAQPGFTLTLSNLVFRNARSSDGPAEGQVSVFVNGAATPHDTIDFSPPNFAIAETTMFFNPVTGVTNAEYRFYGYDAYSSMETMFLDAVSPFGSIAAAPANIPPPVLLPLPVAANQFRFSFNAVSNRAHTVEYRGTLSGTNWTVLTNIPPLAAATSVLISDPLTGSNRFYRVRIP